VDHGSEEEPFGVSSRREALYHEAVPPLHDAGMRRRE
jgi:hypothetical protein